jgi:hypothetical protein
MDQEKGAGHHIITRVAVQNLFTSGHVVDGKVLGMAEEDFANALDDAQAYMDRWYGPTVLPWWAAPDAQREHAMARGDRSGDWNLDADKSWVEDNAVQALISGRNGNIKDAMSQLGAAVHALEDSYSEAHEWRDSSEHSGNPFAVVESINVFDPTGVEGGGGVLGQFEGTHDEHFDKVPLDQHGDIILGDDHAAVNAVTLLLEQWVTEQSASIDQARTDLNDLVAKFFQAAPGDTIVNEHPDAAFVAEDKERRAADDTQVADANTYNPPDIEFFGDLSFAPNPAPAGSDLTLSWQEQNKGGWSNTYTTRLHYFDTNDPTDSYDVEISNAAVNPNDMAQRSYLIAGGIPAGSKWRFELALDPSVSDWDGTLAVEIDTGGSQDPTATASPTASVAPHSGASPAPHATPSVNPATRRAGAARPRSTPSPAPRARRASPAP